MFDVFMIFMGFLFDNVRDINRELASLLTCVLGLRNDFTEQFSEIWKVFS